MTVPEGVAAVAASSNGNIGYAVCSEANQVVAVDTRSGRIISSVRVSKDPGAVAVDGQRHVIYVGYHGTSYISSLRYEILGGETPILAAHRSTFSRSTSGLTSALAIC